MAQPTTREEFKQWCLRKLGAPVLEINIDDDQMDDRITESLKFYADYHFDGSEKVYYKHLVTSTDIDNKYLTLPENINGAVRIFQIGYTNYSASDMFNIRYQIALNDLYTMGMTTSLIPYYMTMEHLALIDELLVGQQPIRYSRHKDRLYIDTDWGGKITEGMYIIVEAYEVIDPDTYTDVWGDRWLQKYVTAQFKLQWGQHLTKFTGMSLPGGVQFNGDRILTDAQTEIEKMEQEMIMNYSMPVVDMVG
jgi:hypothetical protein